MLSDAATLWTSLGIVFGGAGVYVARLWARQQRALRRLATARAARPGDPGDAAGAPSGAGLPGHPADHPGSGARWGGEGP